MDEVLGNGTRYILSYQYVAVPPLPPLWYGMVLYHTPLSTTYNMKHEKRQKTKPIPTPHTHNNYDIINAILSIL